MFFNRLFKFHYGQSQIIFLLFLIFSACSTAPLPDYTQNLDQKTFKHDLLVEINGVRFRGTGVVKKANVYDITVYPTEKIDRIIYQTCHQEQVIDQPPTGWISGKFNFEIKDVPGVSDVNSCSLQIIAMNEDKRVNMFALIEFQDERPEISLPAILKCNGETKSYSNGVSICQSAFNLVEQISFSEPVVQKGASPMCDVMKSKDDMVFTYFMPKGSCTYYFSSQRKLNGKRISHRLQTLGYSEVPVSGVD